MKLPDECYVVVCEFDTFNREAEDRNMIAWETTLPSTLESVKKHQARLGTQYGETMICRLVPVVDEQEGN